jgi:ribosomal protein S18 acetylase RimI-like enzyme
MPIRPLRPADRPSVEQILRSTGHFTEVEITTALELVDAWLECGESSGYHTHILDLSPTASSSDVRGYVCFGPTPLTDGTYDLYWIAVDPSSQRHGHGRHLLSFVESEVQRLGGRLLLIETSSQELYAPTLRFYERAGYEVLARIRDFYRVGDDKVVLGRTVASRE